MRSGTPGFIGERLRSAREARGLSAALLAELIGVSRAAVSQYERGQQTPSPVVAQSIADKLNLPLHHFLRPLPADDPGVVFYRSLSSATKVARTRAQQRYLWLREVVAYLRKYVKFPAVNVPQCEFTENTPPDLSQSSIEESAARTRAFWGMGAAPTASVISLLEKNGIIVARHELGSEKLDAFSQWCQADGTPYVILNSEKASAVRSRFDAAHELAHLVLHRNVSTKQLNTSAIFSLMEDQANRFSGAFLLPETAFANDLHSISLDALRALKAKWRVSVGAMIKRAANLGFVSEAEERRLWINYSRRGWRRREPLDGKLNEETPRYLRRCVELLVEKDVIPNEELPFRLALPPSDIQQMLGLSRGFFECSEPEVELREQGHRDVIPFRAHGLQ